MRYSGGAYARVTNNLVIALVTTGPGGTNSITGVAGAWLILRHVYLFQDR